MKTRKINPEEISVVIQGPIYGTPADPYEKRFTQRSCESIRKTLPGAEIILSTWENSVVDGLDYDRLIINQDPGFNYMTLDGIVRPNNTNRMILSSVNGIKAATKKYCIKMRSDMVILKDDLLELFGVYTNYAEGRAVNERIVTLSATHPVRGAHCAFAVNDWFSLGLKEDLQRVWDVPLQADSDFIKRKDQEYPSWEDNVVAEQYVWTTFLKKTDYYQDKIKLSSMKDLSYNAIGIFEQSIAENLVITTADILKVNSLKLPNRNYVRRDFMKMSCYTHREWKSLYNRYCNGRLRLGPGISDAANKALYQSTLGLQKKVKPLYDLCKRIYNKNFMK